MKNILNKLFCLVLMTISVSLFAQQPAISNFRPYSQDGVNMFETLKSDTTEFTGIKVRIGGNFAQQFQSLDHSNTSSFDDAGEILNPLYDLRPGFNLATANLNIDAQLADGVRLNLVTYLSSRHHAEAWVKGGYIQFDKLEFLNSDFLDNVMDYVTIKVGHMEVNYGDAHFYRTDNGNALHNPFVGNYILDAFNTEIGGEVYYQTKGITAMIGVTGGEIGGNVTMPSTSDLDDNDKRTPAFIGKLAYDSQLNANTRLRLSGSVYHTSSSAANHIYDGDRGGSRYYLVMAPPGVRAGDRGIFPSGRYNPGFSDKVTTFQGNAFLKLNGLEILGTYEMGSGRNSSEADTRNITQLAASALYRFGKTENVYIGTRYNTVTADDISGQEISINRFQAGAGWFVTKNILLKGEYVTQTYNDFPTASQLFDGEFNGIVIEAVVGF